MIDPSKYQSAFESRAKNLGWPQEVIDQIAVQIGDSGTEFDYPPEMQELVMALEYGEFEVPPKPAMRNSKARSDSEAASLVVQKLVTDKLKGSVID